MRKPLKLSQRVLQATGLAAATLNAIQGWDYWYASGGTLSAFTTILADIFAALGLSAAAEAWAARKFARCVIGVLLVAGSATWSGYSVFQKWNADARRASITELERRPEYVDARAALAATSAALQIELRQPPPTCLCPATIREWSGAREEHVAMLQRQHDRQEANLRSLTPAAHTDFGRMFQAVLLGALQLFGGFAFGAQHNAADPPPKSNMRLKASIGGGVLGILARSFHHAAIPAALLGAWPLGNGGVGHAQSPAPGAAHMPPEHTTQTANTKAAHNATVAQARAWALDGVPKVEIARRLGVHRNTVHNWLRLG